MSIKAPHSWFLGLIVGGCLAASLVASPASAAQGWSRPVDVSGALNIGEESPAVNVDSAGNATAVWQVYRGGKLTYESATRQAGGSWSAPSSSFGDLRGAYGLKIVTDSLGNETSVWGRHVGHSWVVQSANRPVGGIWSAPITLSKPGATQGLLAVGAEGVVTAVWLLERDEGRSSVVQSATRPVGGAWSAPVSLSSAKKAARSPQIVIDPQGGATAVWEEEWTGAIESATRSLDGSWSPPVALSATGVWGNSPEVAVDSQGNVMAIWAARIIEGGRIQSRRIQTATLPTGGSWSAPVSISPAGHRLIQEPQIAVDPQGEATAIWQRSDGSNLVVQGATRPTGGSWSKPVELTAGPGQGGQHLQLAVDSSGTATAIWQGFDTRHGTTFAIQAAKRPPGGTWSRAVDISRRTKGVGDPQLAIDSQGTATAIWVIGAKGGAIIQSATSAGG